MRLKEARGRKVVTTENAETIGTVESYVVDVPTHRITAVRLARVPGDASFLSWNDLQFGADAVIVSSADRLRPPRDEPEARAGSKDLQPIGKLVLDAGGNALGKVEDLDFEPGSGAIRELDLGDRGTVSGDRILGLGAYALVVSEAAPAS